MFALKRPTISIRFFSCIRKSMEKSCIIPDVIDAAPKTKAEVVYPSGVKATLGLELTPNDVKHVPFVDWISDDKLLYTLCLTDPDYPTRKEPKLREWHHWLVGNIPGSQVQLGETLSAYIGAVPPHGSGFHRYVFLIYKQPSKIKFEEERLPNDSGDCRGRFSIRKFAKKYNLGHPIAGNFFVAKWDEYVPRLERRLGI